MSPRWMAVIWVVVLIGFFCCAVGTEVPLCADEAGFWRAPGSKPIAVPSARSPSKDARPDRDNLSTTSRPAGFDGVAGRVRTAVATTNLAVRNVTTLPNDDGQVWREYDISPYTLRVISTNRPQQAIVDWILRETGHEAWHSEPVAVLSAGRRTLRVYHTPDVQKVVGRIVDRFVNPALDRQTFRLRIVTVGHPNWRARHQRLLRSVPVKSPGAEAWLLAKENASLLISELVRRTDYREHNSPRLIVHNGQLATLSLTRPRRLVRGVELRGDGQPGLQPRIAQIDEGFKLEFSPLFTLDGKTIDGVLKCNIDQVEKTFAVKTAVSGGGGAPTGQWIRTEVPQLASCRLHERFRWPADKTLLVSLGVVPTPAPRTPTSLALPIGGPPPRADLLLLIEAVGSALAERPLAAGKARRFDGRY